MSYSYFLLTPGTNQQSPFGYNMYLWLILILNFPPSLDYIFEQFRLEYPTFWIWLFLLANWLISVFSVKWKLGLMTGLESLFICNNYRRYVPVASCQEAHDMRLAIICNGTRIEHSKFLHCHLCSGIVAVSVTFYPVALASINDCWMLSDSFITWGFAKWCFSVLSFLLHHYLASFIIP